MAQSWQEYTSNSNDIRSDSNITTYGALILPFDLEKVNAQTQTQTNPKEKSKQMGKIKSALKIDNQTNVLQQAIREATTSEEKTDLQQQLSKWQTFKEEISKNQNVKVLTEYMQDKRNVDKLGSVFGTIGSKFSGIAVTQALMDGNVSSKEALDYLFMGFSPAIGVQGSLMGYSGLHQMKDALSNGHVEVGAFISGFRRVLKGATDLKDMLTRKDSQKAASIIEFDLTISHSEQYQSETPDRRVQSGQSLNEYIHNMPETFDVQCALQDGKRYSKSEFRAILQFLRDRKETVQLILGDEIFDSLILTNFNPNNDCTRSGMDYSLSFKKIIRSDIQTDAEVELQPMPKQLLNDLTSSNISSSSGGVNLPPLNPPDLNKEADNLSETITKAITKGKTILKRAYDSIKATGKTIKKDIQKKKCLEKSF